MSISPHGDDQWYVAATSPRAEEPTRVLKNEDTFAVLDRHGDILSGEDGNGEGLSALGLYHEGTRYLSHWELRLNGQRPFLLSSFLKRDNSLLAVDMTTPDLYRQGILQIPRGSLHIARSVLLARQASCEHLRVVNHGETPVDLTLEFLLGADYRDIFEVRGVTRARRGTLLPSEVGKREVVLGYRGLDGVERRTRLLLDWLPAGLDGSRVSGSFRLAPGESLDLHLTIACCREGLPQPCPEPRRRDAERPVRLVTANEEFNDWINRSAADLDMLVTQTPEGPYPYAGVPWYSTPFGRDGLIAALQTLWLRPALARGVLSFLAATQATAVDPARDAEPGKILHEARSGEMAATGEIPFGRYYGTVDATPLFIVLAGSYYHRTGDRDFIRQLWPHLQAALAWIDDYGDIDRDGFVEYARHSKDGLVQQGWKDSGDSVFHADGRLAEGPIALCEVQGYVYRARRLAAELAEMQGLRALAEPWRAAAERLRQRFDAAFWQDSLGTYALALDGAKQPCAVRASNAGHALWAGIAEPARAGRLVETLMAAESFNGWGIRTLAETERRYNPMSYHNGSVWPHDNGLIAAGMARYGYPREAQKLLAGLFESSIYLEAHRLPELFCGFARIPGQGPILYPVACSPQAWASGAAFQLIQACLGLSFAVDKPQLRFFHPRLPAFVDWLRIENLRVDGGSLDLVLRRHAHDVGVNVERKEGDIEVAIVV